MNWDVLSSVAVYFLACAAIGCWAYLRRRRASDSRRSNEYYIGDRSLGWIVLMFTILASAASAGTFIGGPGLAYEYGYETILTFGAGQIPLGFLMLGLLGKKFSILGRKLNLVTINDFFRHRYESPVVVVLAASSIVVFLMAYLVAQFSGGARVIQAITDIPYETIVIFFGAFIVLYTAFGGFLADSVSDALQGMIMLVSGVVVWAVILATTGGITSLNEKVFESNPEMFTLPGGMGNSFLMSSSFFFLLGPLLVVLPHLIVRGMSYDNSRVMHRAMYIAPIVMFIFTLAFGLIGPVARVYFPNLETADLAVPNIVMELFPGPVAGAILAAPLAAVMSTVDSMILIVSSALLRDLYVNYVKPSTSPKTVARSAPLVSAVVGVIITYLALDPPSFIVLLTVIAVGGLASGLFAPVFGGLYWTRGNATGALLALVGGVTYFVAATEFVPELALGMTPAVMASLTSCALYIVGSILGPPPSRATLIKFWGTQREIEAVDQASPAPVGQR